MAKKKVAESDHDIADGIGDVSAGETQEVEELLVKLKVMPEQEKSYRVLLNLNHNLVGYSPGDVITGVYNPKWVEALTKAGVIKEV